MGKLFSRKYLLFATVVAVTCGFLRAFWMFGELPSQRALLSAARGVAAHEGMAHYTASLADSGNGWLWRTGGTAWLQTAQGAYLFVEALAIALFFLVIVRLGAGFLKSKGLKRAILTATVIILLTANGLTFIRGFKFRQERIADLKLIAPVELDGKVGKFGKEEVYTNAEGAAALPLFAEKIAEGVSPAEFGFVGNPKGWREALRKSRWKAVLLTGPASNFRPLLDHLVASPDWTLSEINNHGYLFIRGAGSPPPAFEAKEFHLGNDRETAIYLAQVSAYYDAIHRNSEARECIERALKLAPENALVLSYAATFAAAHKHWQDAIAYAEKALERDPEFLQAKVVEAMALLELGQPERARRAVADVLAKAPDDFYTLFIYARICRAVNDYTNEAATLEQIIALCRKNSLPTGNYQLYLGQAYARLGMAKPALLNYRAALESGLLEQNQIDEIKDAIKTIETRDKP